MDRITYPQMIVQGLSFFAAIFATVWAVELYRLLRTGEVGRTWRVIIAATILFAVGEVLKFGELFEFLPRLGMFNYLHLPFIILLAYACYAQRKAFFMPQHFRSIFLQRREPAADTALSRSRDYELDTFDYDLQELELLEPIDGND